MSEPAIEAVNLSKKFRIKSEARQSFKERLVRGRSNPHRDFWALRDATFAVPRGASLGLIGHNGSGKSTALKVLAGIYRPTSGYVKVNGRVSALLEVGAGFHPDLTGRENVRLNGAVLGFSGQQITRMMDEIIEFADIGEFIDNPIKHYSSGMHVRLGFAVAVMVRPEILIVDEVIAVGDEEFQRKCYDHLHDLRTHGTTMLIVSHGMGQINQICDEAVWLERGEVQQLGPARKVTQAYLDRVNQNEAAKSATSADRDAPDASPEAGHRGTGEIRITDVDFLGIEGELRSFLIAGQATTMRISYRCTSAVDRVTVSVGLENADGLPVMGSSSDGDGAWQVPEGPGRVLWTLDPLLVAPGPYVLRVSVSSDGRLIDGDDEGIPITVRDGGMFQGGLFIQPGSWALESGIASQTTGG